MKKTTLDGHKPVLMAFFIQLMSLIVIVPLTALLPSISMFGWAVFHGVAAAFMSYFFKMATWWIPIQLCFMPAIVATLAIGLSPLWYGFGFCLLVLVYGKTFQTQVPLYLSSDEVTLALTSLLPRKKNFTFS